MTSPSPYTVSGISSPHHTTINNHLPTQSQTEGTSTINDLKETKKEKQKNKKKKTKKKHTTAGVRQWSPT
ncbi:hypothetical protein M440DRAFT_1091905 [Trichoderma longibrachiatum ATCC 18648]|uniref:Uncharacterized protein n=1 Tax=Trichoderma longibrachiatum ATCC 18648 TaxID=983965 RepID=A0A2T4BTB2_TRILO|nr:hypothetical protein M440DRAFT_1091905 [Trichoderma longibrachiatum ATCC 18648]